MIPDLTKGMKNWEVSKENSNSKVYMGAMFTAALFTIAKAWKQPKRPLTDEWIKLWCVCVCVMEYYSARKRKEIMPFAVTRKDLEIIILNEVRQRKI